MPTAASCQPYDPKENHDHPTAPDRERHVLRALNRHQTNAVLMHQNYKKYHWPTYGPHLRGLHLLSVGGEFFSNPGSPG